MGVLSLRRYLERTAGSAVVTEPPSIPPVVNAVQTSDSAEGACRDAAASGGVRHLFFDMNAVAHMCFDSTAPSGPVATGVHPNSITGLQRRIFDVLSKALRFFPPTYSVNIVFDGPAPTSKLNEQRARRRRYVKASDGAGGAAMAFLATTDTATASSSSSAAAATTMNRFPISEAELTAGSPVMLQLESSVSTWMRDTLWARAQGGSTAARDGGCGGEKSRQTTAYGLPEEIVVVGTRVPGEGENKITRRLAELAVTDGLCVYAGGDDDDDVAVAETTEEGDGSSDEVQRPPRHQRNDHRAAAQRHSMSPVVVIGCDADLMLAAIAATPYYNIWLVHPVSYICTSLGDILLSWLRPHGGSSHGRVASHQLNSVRVDFCFLFLLAGGDHYVGIEDECITLWNRYCTLRSTTHKADALVYMGRDDSMHINAALFRAIVGSPDAKRKKGGNASSSSSRGGSSLRKARDRSEQRNREANVCSGESLLRNALWALTTIVTGRCVDYRFRAAAASGTSATDKNVSIHELQSAAQRSIANIRVPIGQEPPLLPLQAYTATVVQRTVMPPSVRQVLDDGFGLLQSSKQIEGYQSVSHVLRAVDDIFDVLRNRTADWSNPSEHRGAPPVRHAVDPLHDSKSESVSDVGGTKTAPPPSSSVVVGENKKAPNSRQKQVVTASTAADGSPVTRRMEVDTSVVKPVMLSSSERRLLTFGGTRRCCFSVTKAATGASSPAAPPPSPPRFHDEEPPDWSDWVRMPPKPAPIEERADPLSAVAPPTSTRAPPLVTFAVREPKLQPSAPTIGQQAAALEAPGHAAAVMDTGEESQDEAADDDSDAHDVVPAPVAPPAEGAASGATATRAQSIASAPPPAVRWIAPRDMIQFVMPSGAQIELRICPPRR